jgi:hypothetical protein
MTNESYARHWLEEAIGDEREPQRILEAIIARPEFRDAIGEAVAVSQRTSNSAKQTRIIAEHIVRVLYRRFNGFVALH